MYSTKDINTAVILAAGRGTRLQPYTYDLPKGFMKVGGETLIERSVRLLQKNGIKHIIIGTGHIHEQYEKLAQKAGLRTYLNPDFATTGSFHTLYCGKDLINDDFLLLESDLLYHEAAIQSLLEDSNDDLILCSGFTNSNDEVYVSSHNGLLQNLSKKKEELDSVDAELVGIWKISHRLYQRLLIQHAGAVDALIKDYEKAIALEAHNGYGISVKKLDNLVWCEIDNEEHLERAINKILPRL